MSLRRSLVVLLPFAAACAEDPTQPEAGAPLRMDSLEYTLERNSLLIAVDVGFTYENVTDAPVWLPECRGVLPPRLEQKQGETWVVAWTAILPSCTPAPPRQIDPGEQFGYGFPVSAGLPGTDILPKFQVSALDGTYRLVWGIYLDEALTALAPLEERVSNEFVLIDPG